MKLIIAEKPSLAKNIARAIKAKDTFNGGYYNSEYVVSYAYGHLLSLKDVNDYIGKKTAWKNVKLPFIPETFEFQPKDDSGVKKQLNILKGLIHKDNVDSIIHCGDADREGQIIIDLILDYLKNTKPVFRLWLPEQTDATIVSSILEMEDNSKYKTLHSEGLARTYIDWLFGINLTRYVTLEKGNLYPCGRVLIPIVKYICDRDRIIKNFIPVKYFQLESPIEKDGVKFTLASKTKYSLVDKDKALERQNALNSMTAQVIEIVKKQIEKKPYHLFSLSKLQSTLSSKYKIGFDTSLKVIQGLYEKGYLTYPRTNTEFLSNKEKGKVQSLLKKFPQYNLIMKNGKNIFDDSKIESHSAIIITEKIPSSLSDIEEKVYNTVKNRFLSNFFQEKTLVNQVTVKIKVGDDKEIFTLKGESLAQKGFFEIEPQRLDNELPSFEKGESFDVDFKLVEKESKPPNHVTESELASYLKSPYKKDKNSKIIEEQKKGTTIQEEVADNEIENEEQLDYKEILKGVEIGTEATRTGIVQNAIKYNYIKRIKQNYYIEEKGEDFIDTLDRLSINLYKERTVEFSVALKNIYKGEESVDELLEKTKVELNSIIDKEKLEKSIEENNFSKDPLGRCPVCGNNIMEGKNNFYCQGYKEYGCKFSIWKNNGYFKAIGAKLTKDKVKELLADGKVKYNNLVSKKSGKTYSANISLEVELENGALIYAPYKEDEEATSKIPEIKNISFKMSF